MKIFRNLLLGVAGALSLTACSQSDEAAPDGRDGMTVRVVTADAFGDRAVTIIDGYQLKCVMQLIADDGVTIGNQSILNTVDGAATFLILPQYLKDGATKALFWAEYVPTGAAPKVYDSGDLTNVKYNVSALDISAGCVAMDAWCGKLDELADGATVTLTRPLARVSFAPTNPAAARGQNAVIVSYDAPQGFNVADGTVGDEPAALALTNTALVPDAEEWFATMILAPQVFSENVPTLDSDLTMEVSGRIDQTITIPAGTIPLQANKQIRLTGEIEDIPSQDINISVGIEDLDYINDPDRAVEMTVGCYVRADGRATMDVNSAVGIVFAMEPIHGDDPENYPEAFHEKTIKAYAVALENTGTRTNLSTKSGLEGLFTQNSSITNGTQYTSTLFEGLGEDSPTVIKWNTWVDAHPLEGSNVTGWYVPSGAQLEEWGKMIASLKLFTNAQVTEGPTGTAEFRALFPESNLFDRTPAASVKYLSCSINANGYPSGMQLNPGDPISAAFSQYAKATNPTVIRPMITIFE